MKIHLLLVNLNHHSCDQSLQSLFNLRLRAPDVSRRHGPFFRADDTVEEGKKTVVHRMTTGGWLQGISISIDLHVKMSYFRAETGIHTAWWLDFTSHGKCIRTIFMYLITWNHMRLQFFFIIRGIDFWVTAALESVVNVSLLSLLAA